jgi:hypothetical protein
MYCLEICNTVLRFFNYLFRLYNTVLSINLQYHLEIKRYYLEIIPGLEVLEVLDIEIKKVIA